MTDLTDRKSDRVALIVVAGLLAVKIGLHLYANLLPYYEFHRDEFLYFAMGEHLRLFGMDFPPFIAILSEVVRGLLGDSLIVIRLIPMMAGAALMIIAVAAAGELGGGWFAQGFAALSVLCSTLFLRSANLFQPVVFDQLWWSLGLFFLLKFGVSQKQGWWIWFGVAMGLGLLTKFSILIFGFAVFVALLATPQRRRLATKWPWLAAGLVLVIGSPSIFGQINLGWPVFGQVEAINVQFEQVTYLDFVVEQFEMVPAFPFAVAGAIGLIAGRFGPRLRMVGLAPVIAFLSIMLFHGKAYYAGPLYPVLLGAGAVMIERVSHRIAKRVIQWGAVALLGVYLVVLLPLGIPILEPAKMEAYLVKLGMQDAAQTNVGDQERIPQDYADMLNWRQQVEALADVYANLPEADRSRAVILASNYGEAGAIDFYGPHLGLPPAKAIVGTYWHFGPGDQPGEVVISIGFSRETLVDLFAEAELVETVSHPYAVAEERDLQIFVARHPYQTLQELWPSFEGRH